MAERKDLPHWYPYVWEEAILERNDPLGIPQKLG
jgi:hypothetical protein